MVFSSFAFAKFFAIVLAALAVARTRTQRQAVLLAASIFFYGYWDIRYLALLATPSIIDFICASRIERSDDPATRRRWLLLSVTSNLGLLGYFKYADFFLSSVASATGATIQPLNVLLPVGISFYIFKTLSYTIDVYRREIPAERSLWKYAMFVTYFPELVAGPIVRASIFLPQMTRELRPSLDRTLIGAQMILLGLTKKVVIADRFAPFVDAVFAKPADYSPLTVLSAVVAYSLQIYCDFSGYSDMAIGVSRIIGFDLPENFNMPYLSTSVTEFWRRWHISLSAWLRDYLYIPLGGNRRGPMRTYFNLFATMLLGGLWHGASWNFVLWGALHGIGLAVHKLWTGRRLPALPAPVGWVVTYAFVCVGWVFFRAESFPVAWTIMQKLTGLAPGGIEFAYLPLLWLIPVVVVAHLIGVSAAHHTTSVVGEVKAGLGAESSAPALLAPLYRWSSLPFAMRAHPQSGVFALFPVPTFAGAFLGTLWLLAVVLFANVGTRPFIYFQF